MFTRLKRILFPQKYLLRELIAKLNDQELHQKKLAAMREELGELRRESRQMHRNLLALIHLVMRDCGDLKPPFTFPELKSDENLAELFLQLGASDSYSELRRDLWVLWELDKKEEGVFVELTPFGSDATLTSSVLQLKFRWRGIYLDPDSLGLPRWRDGLVTKNHSEHFRTHVDGMTAPRTRDLNEQFKTRGVPETIDYLALPPDVNPLEILQRLGLQELQIQLISVPHHFSDVREFVHRLLIQDGYERRFERLSQWEDWYCKRLV